jgi:hypothetical protein
MEKDLLVQLNLSKLLSVLGSLKIIILQKRLWQVSDLKAKLIKNLTLNSEIFLKFSKMMRLVTMSSK